jgi:hypothetical protein
MILARQMDCRPGSKGIAPALYNLAWHKNIMVADALCNGKWMQGLRRISSTSEISQFVHL